MKTVFGDNSLSVHFIQQMFYETYNDDVIVDGSYYTTYDMNYGFAHYIAKYLDSTYPVLDAQTKEAYATNTTNTTRDITLPISIMNYFLCDNNGNRLTFTPTNTPDEYEQSNENELYRKIYNKYSIVYNVPDSIVPAYAPATKYKKYMNNNDLPLFIDYDGTNYSVNTNSIFTLSGWNISKGICEIDDYVASFLLGRTIGPNSSMEDIYYAQKLLIRDREITNAEKGIWCLPGQDGTPFDMTQTVINYQKARIYKSNTTPLFVTGYFDIYTEGYVLKEIGGDINVILGL